MPTPRSGTDPAPRAGRHRRPAPPSRLVLLTLFAVFTLLLGSGTAISLTAGEPARGPAGPDRSAVGAAPDRTTPAPDPPATRPPGVASGPAPEEDPTGDPTPDDPAPDRPDPDPEPDPDEPPDEITQWEDEVAALTNEARAEAGCGELEIDERLRSAARAHSQDMAEHDYFSHTGRDGRSPFDRMRDAGYPDAAGENIAMGYRSPEAVMEGWMGSEGHRDNLLNCDHRAIGVGLAYNADGVPYWTQNFGR